MMKMTDVYLVTSDFRVYAACLDEQKAKDYARDYNDLHGIGYANLKVEKVPLS